MMEFRKIALTELDFNTGQIPGLPPNPREWTDLELKRLAKSMKNTPELVEARGCIVIPYEGRYVVLGGNLRLAAAKFLKWRDIMCAVLPEGTKVAKLKEIVLKKASGTAIYGKGYIVSDRVKAEREKAEREKAERWTLSDRELAIIHRLNQQHHEKE